MVSTHTSLLACVVSLALGLAACTTPPVEKPPVAPPPTAKPGVVLKPATFAALPGWEQDDLREAWPAFLLSCKSLVRKDDWQQPCLIAPTVDGSDAGAVRRYFEALFVPQQVVTTEGAETGLVTGYYEPLLRGARTRGGPYQVPLYRAPDDLLTIDLTSLYPELKGMRLRGRVVGHKVVPYASRAEMAQSNALAGMELVWVDDAIDAFFLEVQGSGRVQLVDSNETVRLAYADQNGHPYKSIGRYLVDRGEMTLDRASAQSIRAWYLAHPERRQELLNVNPSYVFFREEKLTDPNQGPKGALGVPLTARRSIAVDPQAITLGVPVFLATTWPLSEAPLQRLMVAQDTGGAIRGAPRADFFWGFGTEAAEQAGKMKQRGAMWVLLPKRADER